MLFKEFVATQQDEIRRIFKSLWDEDATGAKLKTHVASLLPIINLNFNQALFYFKALNNDQIVDKAYCAPLFEDLLDALSENEYFLQSSPVLRDLLDQLNLEIIYEQTSTLFQFSLILLSKCFYDSELNDYNLKLLSRLESIFKSIVNELKISNPTIEKFNILYIEIHQLLAATHYFNSSYARAWGYARDYITLMRNAERAYLAVALESMHGIIFSSMIELNVCIGNVKGDLLDAKKGMDAVEQAQRPHSLLMAEYLKRVGKMSIEKDDHRQAAICYYRAEKIFKKRHESELKSQPSLVSALKVDQLLLQYLFKEIKSYNALFTAEKDRIGQSVLDKCLAYEDLAKNYDIRFDSKADMHIFTPKSLKSDFSKLQSDKRFTQKFLSLNDKDLIAKSVWCISKADIDYLLVSLKLLIPTHKQKKKKSKSKKPNSTATILVQTTTAAVNDTKVPTELVLEITKTTTASSAASAASPAITSATTKSEAKTIPKAKDTPELPEEQLIELSGNGIPEGIFFAKYDVNKLKMGFKKQLKGKDQRNLADELITQFKAKLSRDKIISGRGDGIKWVKNDYGLDHLAPYMFKIKISRSNSKARNAGDIRIYGAPLPRVGNDRKMIIVFDHVEIGSHLLSRKSLKRGNQKVATQPAKK